MMKRCLPCAILIRRVTYPTPKTYWELPMFQTVTPIDGSIYLECPTATADEIDRVLSLARAAQREWGALSLGERAEFCTRMVGAFVADKDQIPKELTWQMGRLVRHSVNEVRGFEERARYMISIAEKSLADVQRDPKSGFTRFIRREPVGVVLVLAPWNYPYLTSINSIVPALMAGNTVILKHSFQTPLCAERIADACRTAGLPEGVFQFLHASHEDVAKMIDDERIGFVSFTGSVAGGDAGEQAARKRFFGTGLGIGGKKPADFRADAHPQNAIQNIVGGAVYYSGRYLFGIVHIF